MKERKTPFRKCIGCNENKPKKNLLRIVKDKDGNVSVDVIGKASGRGAYICNNIECLEKVRKGNKLSRALKIRISDEIYENILKELTNNE